MRRACRGLTAGAVTLASLVAAAAPVGATAPDRVGWWSRASVVPGAAAPAPPGADLVVQNDPSGPTAYSAVHYAGIGSSGSATLTLASSNGDITLPPGAGLAACPVTKPGWAAAAGGPIADAPTYASSGCADGTVAGPKVVFSLPASAQTTPGALDVAIVPTGPAPFVVGFAKPDDSSLVAPPPDTASSGSFDGSSSTFSPDPSASASTPSGSAPSSAVTTEPSSGLGPSLSPAGTAGGFDTGTAPSLAPSGAAASPTPSFTGTSATRSRVATTPVRNAAAARPFHDNSRGDRLLAVGVLAALLGALWWLGGSPVRAPRLLGSLGGGGGPGAVGVPAGPAERTGGIGRFARPRSGGPKPI